MKYRGVIAEEDLKGILAGYDITEPMYSEGKRNIGVEEPALRTDRHFVGSNGKYTSDTVVSDLTQLLSMDYPGAKVKLSNVCSRGSEGVASVEIDGRPFKVSWMATGEGYSYMLHEGDLFGLPEPEYSRLDLQRKQRGMRMFDKVRELIESGMSMGEAMEQVAKDYPDLVEDVGTGFLISGAAKYFEGWSDERCKKQWSSLGGSFDKVVEKMKGKVDSPEAYASALHKRVKGKFPQEKRSVIDSSNADELGRKFGDGLVARDHLKARNIEELLEELELHAAGLRKWISSSGGVLDSPESTYFNAALVVVNAEIEKIKGSVVGGKFPQEKRSGLESHTKAKLQELADAYGVELGRNSGVCYTSGGELYCVKIISRDLVRQEPEVIDNFVSDLSREIYIDPENYSVTDHETVTVYFPQEKSSAGVSVDAISNAYLAEKPGGIPANWRHLPQWLRDKYPGISFTEDEVMLIRANIWRKATGGETSKKSTSFWSQRAAGETVVRFWDRKVGVSHPIKYGIEVEIMDGSRVKIYKEDLLLVEYAGEKVRTRYRSWGQYYESEEYYLVTGRGIVRPSQVISILERGFFYNSQAVGEKVSYWDKKVGDHPRRSPDEFEDLESYGLYVGATEIFKTPSEAWEYYEAQDYKLAGTYSEFKDSFAQGMQAAGHYDSSSFLGRFGHQAKTSQVSWLVPLKSPGGDPSQLDIGEYEEGSVALFPSEVGAQQFAQRYWGDPNRYTTDQGHAPQQMATGDQSRQRPGNPTGAHSEKESSFWLRPVKMASYWELPATTPSLGYWKEAV